MISVLCKYTSCAKLVHTITLFFFAFLGEMRIQTENMKFNRYSKRNCLVKINKDFAKHPFRLLPCCPVLWRKSECFVTYGVQAFLTHFQWECRY